VKLQRLRERQVEEPEFPLVLMLGSSRTLVGIRAGRMQSTPDGRPALAFNFGLQGGGALMELVCLRRLLDAGIRPDLLFVEILPLLFNQPGTHPVEEEWLRGERLSISELAFSRSYHSDPSRLYYQWVKVHWFPWTAYRGALGGAPPGIRDWGSWMDAHGWNHHFLAPLTAEYRQRLTRETIKQYSGAVGEFRLALGPAQALSDLLDLCRQQGIRTVLLLMPEGSAFRGMYTPSARAGIDDFVGELSRKRDLRLIDAREWVEDDGFWDSHHLLPTAADAFSDRLWREALSLYR
jgi:hypothetical protein